MNLTRIFSKGYVTNWFTADTIIPVVGLPILAYGIYRIVVRRTMGSVRFVSPNSPPSWNWSSKDIIERANKIVEDAVKFYDSLAELEDPSINNLVRPFMQHENRMQLETGQLTFFQHVSEDEGVRAASVEVTEVLQNLQIDLFLRHDLYVKFDTVWKQIKDNKYEKGTEGFEVFRYVEKCIKDFLRAGLDLSKEKREEVKKLRKLISFKSLKFSENMGKQNEYIAFSKEELEGVSQSVLEQFETFWDERTKTEKYKVTFKYPDIFPVMKTAKRTETRRKAFVADQNKTPENEEILLETLTLREKLAELLGYATYAGYNLDNKMAKKEEVVFDFLKDLKDRLLPLAKKELKHLKAMKKKECEELSIPFDGEYYSWDHRYYDNTLMKEKYNVDFEKISEYFPIESSISGMLNIYEKLFNLKFIEQTKTIVKNIWNDDVKLLAVYEMEDSASSKFLGWIYFDLHPREGKFGHAANFSLAPSFIDEEGRRSYPVTALVCNFSKPSSKKPSLLKHDELNTFFHELGHGIHHLVGKNMAARMNGPSSVPWDFVEAPSQMFEFWTWNKEDLLAISHHYETGKKIPESLLDALIATKHINGAMSILRQIRFGLFDMKIHTTKHLGKLDLLNLWNDSMEEVSLLRNGNELTKGYDSFGHIMSSSYSAGYYGYLWAQVFATDMYYTRFAANPLDSKVGVDYRDIVLARGSLYEIKDDVHEFLGRDSANEAFFIELGLDNIEIKK